MQVLSAQMETNTTKKLQVKCDLDNKVKILLYLSQF